MNDKLLWFTARGAGTISLLLLTAVLVLGVLSYLRTGSSWWPRFLTPAFHRNLALTAVVFLGIHIATAVIDPFTHLGLTAVFVPFGSHYRTMWLGLGTLAFELLLAVVATSLLRPALGATVWKVIHLASYPLWVIAVVHGIGTGTDTKQAWMIAITAICVGAFAGATTARLLNLSLSPLRRERTEASLAYRGGSR